MLLKGDKIKQVKEINGFNKVGIEFEVLNIDMGVISFGSDFGKGVMSYDEFEKYFEKVVKEEWSDWNDHYTDFQYRIKGKLIECRFNDDVHTFAKCLPEDDFDLNIGLEICRKKYQIKKLEKELKSF